jgi:hypothetical protein
MQDPPRDENTMNNTPSNIYTVVLESYYRRTSRELELHVVSRGSCIWDSGVTHHGNFTANESSTKNDGIVRHHQHRKLQNWRMTRKQKARC